MLQFKENAYCRIFYNTIYNIIKRNQTSKFKETGTLEFVYAIHGLKDFLSQFLRKQAQVDLLYLSDSSNYIDNKLQGYQTGIYII